MPDKAARTVIYKPDPHGPEYLVFVDDVVEYERWKAGDRSIALALIIGKFAIYSAPKGHTGPLNEVSRQEIENVFFGGENNVKDKSVEAAIVIILENGKLHTGDLSHSQKETFNASRGAGEVRGIGAGTGSHR